MKFINLAVQESHLNYLIHSYRVVSPIRPDILFRHFLPTGYRFTMIDSVDSHLRETAIFAKIHLGMLITLYDDLADHPQYRNPELLNELYCLNIEKDRLTPLYFRGHQREVFELARDLFLKFTALLQEFPNFDLLKSVLAFDIEHFYLSNRHSELVTDNRYLGNVMESRLLGPHNMGMVAAGTIDLMASSGFVFKELGLCREVFLLGQRIGRISNLVFTFKREKEEGDCTNEILIAERNDSSINYRAGLLRELRENQMAIRTYSLKTFDTYPYATGLLDLHSLHSSLEGKI